MNYNLSTINRSNIQNSNKRWYWSNICIDLLLFANVVAYYLTCFINGGFKFVAICSAFVFLIIFVYKRKKRELDYSLFTETMPILVHLFGLYILLSTGWSINRQSTFHMFVAYEICAVLFSFFYVHYRSTDDGINRIQRVLVFSGLFISIAVVAYLGVDELSRLHDSGKRMMISNEYDEKLFNVNSFAFVLLGTWLVLFVSLLNEGLRVRTLFMIPLVLLICLTGSRKGCYGIILVSFVVLVVSLLKQSNFRKRFWIFIVIILISLSFMILFRSQFVELIMHRTENSMNGMSGSDDTRLALIKLGWEIFLENPLVGCGIDCPRFISGRVLNFQAYLHNNMAELLAGGGLCGFVLFYSKFFLLIRTNQKSLMEKSIERDNVRIVSLCIGFLVVILIYDFGSVSYYNFGVLCYSLPLYVYYGNYCHRSLCK